MDGPIELTEPVANCRRCRRSFFPQRKALGFDSRQSTPGLKRKLVFLNAESRSLKRAAITAERVLEIKVSTNTIERICLDVGADIEAASEADWKGVIDGEAIVPQVAIVSCDGGRIRTRKTDCGPGVHLSGKGWNETKNAIFVVPQRAKHPKSIPNLHLRPVSLTRLM